MIEPDYLSCGIRHRSQELATLVLGLRLNRDRIQARTRQLEREYVTEDDYDYLIRGWAYYWNAIFKPINPLDPNLIKALMATESMLQRKIK